MENQIPEDFLNFVKKKDEKTYTDFQFCINNFQMKITMDNIESGKIGPSDGYVNGPLNVNGKEIDMYELIKKLNVLYTQYKGQNSSGGKRRKSRRNRKSKKSKKSRKNRKKSKRRSRR